MSLLGSLTISLLQLVSLLLLPSPGVETVALNVTSVPGSARTSARIWILDRLSWKPSVSLVWQSKPLSLHEHDHSPPPSTSVGTMPAGKVPRTRIGPIVRWLPTPKGETL